MSSPLQDSMEGLIQVFYSYSGKEGDKFKLSKAELITLLNGELSELMTACNDPTMVDKIMKNLDDNKDGEVDFQEFVNLVAAITVLCNDFFVEYNKSKEGGAKK
ncbi:S-100 protein alpha chain [Collichthys lucidus]|nr:S-100 protein alpha chain [Collichthys lucidus]